jgi:hypothetical protein
MLRFEFLALPTKVYSLEYVEGRFYELRLLDVLRSWLELSAVAKQSLYRRMS